MTHLLLHLHFFSLDQMLPPYCGNNRLALRQGQQVGTKLQCLKRGIGIGSRLPVDSSYEHYDPIDARKWWCGNGAVPAGYDFDGSPSICLRKGIGVGKRQALRRQGSRRQGSRRATRVQRPPDLKWTRVGGRLVRRPTPPRQSPPRPQRPPPVAPPRVPVPPVLDLPVLRYLRSASRQSKG